MTDPKFEMEHAGLWSNWCWEMPFGDNAMIMQWCLVTLSLRQGHTLKYKSQEEPGIGSIVQAFHGKQGWQAEEGNEKQCLLSSTAQAATGDPPNLWHLSETQWDCVESRHTSVHSRTQDTHSCYHTTEQTTEEKVWGHAKSYFYQLEEKLQQLLVQNMATFQT